MSSNLAIGGEAPDLEALAVDLTNQGVAGFTPRSGPLRVWSVKQAAVALLDAADASRLNLPVLTGMSLYDTAFVPVPTEGFDRPCGGRVASLEGLLADLARLGGHPDPIVEDARCRFELAAREALKAGLVLWLG